MKDFIVNWNVLKNTVSFLTVTTGNDRQIIDIFFEIHMLRSILYRSLIVQSLSVIDILHEHFLSHI